MKKYIPTFDEFVNEATDADGFNPTKASDADLVVAKIKTLDELVPGKEYRLNIDGNNISDLVYQGVTDGYYIFNEEDHNTEPKTFNKAAIEKIVAAGGVEKVSM